MPEHALLLGYLEHWTDPECLLEQDLGLNKVTTQVGS